MKNTLYLIFIGLYFSVGGCANSGSEAYSSLVKKELAKNTRVDSIFLGVHFGMASKAFFSYCWELNKKGIISDGTNNTMVLYKIDTALNYPASMNFYPDFYQDKIYNVRVTFQYNAWAPWNKGLFADSLLPNVLGLLKKWHPGGNEFITMKDKKKGTIYVKVDGNRRITLGIFDDMIVKANYTDLVAEAAMKKAIKK